jgi:hypothetical protein
MQLNRQDIRPDQCSATDPCGPSDYPFWTAKEQVA